MIIVHRSNSTLQAEWMHDNPFIYKELIMIPVNEQFAALSKAQFDTVLKTVEFASDHLEKLADVQVKAAKAAYADGVKAVKQLATLKDVAEAAAYSSGLAQPTLEKTTDYAKSVYEVVAGAQAGLASMLEEQVAEFNKTMVVTLDSALKSAPAGSEGAVAAAKSAIHSANTVYESMVKAAKQMAAMTEANIAAVTAQAAPSRKKSS
jgi:phasin family protein